MKRIFNELVLDRHSGPVEISSYISDEDARERRGEVRIEQEINGHHICLDLLPEEANALSAAIFQATYHIDKELTYKYEQEVLTPVKQN